MSPQSTSARARRGSLESHLCRKGLTVASARWAQLELPLDGHDLLGLVRATGRLTVFDLELLAWLTERWRQERGADRWVRFSLYELGQAFYGREPDGSERRRFRASLRRLVSITVELVGYNARTQSGDSRISGAAAHILDNVQSELDRLGLEPEPGAVGALRGSVFEARLADWMTAQVEAGHVTYLKFDTLRALPGLAKRLWIYLEAERMTPLGDSSVACWVKLGDRAYMTLGMNYTQERQARAALKRACAAITGIDHRYKSVTVERRPGGWALIAHRVTDSERARIRRLARDSIGTTESKAA